MTHEPTHRWRIADQVLDGIVGFVLVVLTGGTSSPFFSYLSFPVFFATLRWQWPGALAAGTPVLVAFVALAPLEIYRGAVFETNTFIVRTVYLGALTGLLCYVGAYDRRARRAMVAAATWSPPSGVEPAGMATLFEAAAAVLEPSPCGDRALDDRLIVGGARHAPVVRYSSGRKTANETCRSPRGQAPTSNTRRLRACPWTTSLPAASCSWIS
jgi:hypothetical protein